MSSAADTTESPPVLPRPSVFISYASENRAAARLLRDALAAAGLDVWYDENELGGGDAWDHKIRRQIRECTYFMPVISAQTEARREGYFRREWRLAVDRSHDMADDVMFLVPVVIDGTVEGGARVPEKFLTVQWLRLPGGVATPALRALAARLAAGDHHAAPPPAARPFIPPPPPKPAGRHTARAARDDEHPGEGPPPMPPFPQRPADSRENLKYFAEVFWWFITSAWLLFKRLPKWARILVVIWLIFGFGTRCSSRDDETPRKRAKAAPTAPAAAKSPDSEDDTAKTLKEAADQLERTAKEGDTTPLGAGFARAGAEIARAVSAEIARKAAPTQLGVIPFATGLTEAAEKQFAQDAFSNVFAQLALARPGWARPLVSATGQSPADDVLKTLARTAKDTHVLAARVETDAGGRVLIVTLLSVEKPEPLWKGRYPLTDGRASVVADDVTKNVLDALAPEPAKTPAKPDPKP